MNQLRKATLFVIVGIIIVYACNVFFFISNLKIHSSFNRQDIFRTILSMITDTAFKMSLLYFFLNLYRRQ